jgi:hypothetical protein
MTRPRLAVCLLVPLLAGLPAFADDPDVLGFAARPGNAPPAPANDGKLIHRAIEQVLADFVESTEPGSVENAARLLEIPAPLAPPDLETPAVTDKDEQAAASPVPLTGQPSKRRAMVGRCDAMCRWISGALAAAGVGALITLDPEENAGVGDVTRYIPAAAGLAMTLIGGDMQGLKQWSLVGATSLFATWGLKNVADKERPNAENFKSFPSGHATAGFFGAGFIYRRYGPRWGVPAYLVAAYTGATRVDAERHYMDDVISSFSLSLMSNWLFTTPISDRVAINPMLADNRVGFSVSVATTGGSGENGSPDESYRQTRFRYQWEFGPASISENSVSSDGGDPIDFRFDQQNDPLYAAQIALDWYPGNPRGDVLFGFTPFEIRDFGTIESDTDFAGAVFPEGKDVRSRAVAYDLTAAYRYQLLPDSHLDVRVGGGFAVFYTLDGLAVVNRRESVPNLVFEQVNALTVLPIVHLHLGYGFGRKERWSVFAEADGMDLSADRYLDATAQVRFRITPQWDLGLGYRHLERTVDTNSLDTATTRDQYVFAIGYRF